MLSRPNPTGAVASTGLPEEVVQQFDLAMKLGLRRGRLNRGNALVEEGKFEQVIADYRTCSPLIRKTPGRSAHWRKR